MNRAAEMADWLLVALLLTAGCGYTLYFLSVPPTEILLANGKTEQYSPNETDAVWFTVQTMTTTGYGSLPMEVWTPKLKWASVVLMLCGGILWTFFIGFLVNLVFMRLIHEAGNPGG